MGNVNEPSSQPWLNYIFDVQVSSGGRALEQFNGLHSNPENTLGSAHSLRRPGSIGTHDEVHSTQVSTELWHDISMDKARAYIAIDSNLKNTGEKVLPPDTASGSLRANLYCEEWAQARASTSDAKLKKAFKKNWQKQRTVKVTAPMKPYPVGAYWVIPVEVTLPKSDFNSNCL